MMILTDFAETDIMLPLFNKVCHIAFAIICRKLGVIPTQERCCNNGAAFHEQIVFVQSLDIFWEGEGYLL